MSADTKIGWADDSVNLWWGCVEVGPGCTNCYARVLSQRYGYDVWGVHKPRRVIASAFDALAKSQKRAKAEGRRRNVFLNSMSDLAEILPDGHPQRIEIDNLRYEFFVRVNAGHYPDLNLIWLTKRIGNVSKVALRHWMEGMWPENLWIVPTITDQAEAERDIPKLLMIPAKVKGLSCEPLLSAVDLRPWLFPPYSGPGCTCGDGECSECWQRPAYDDPLLNWLIVGGESGPNRRPMPIEAARSLIAQGAAAKVPVFVKQDSAYKDGQQGRFTDSEWAIKQTPGDLI